MLQQIVVFAIVAVAAAYAGWKLMPRALRARLAQASVGWARRRGKLSDAYAAALAQRLTASGCGACDSCGACAPSPKATSAPAPLQYVAQQPAEDRAPH